MHLDLAEFCICLRKRWRKGGGARAFTRQSQVAGSEHSNVMPISRAELLPNGGPKPERSRTGTILLLSAPASTQTSYQLLGHPETDTHHTLLQTHPNNSSCSPTHAIIIRSSKRSCKRNSSTPPPPTMPSPSSDQQNSSQFTCTGLATWTSSKDGLDLKCWGVASPLKNAYVDLLEHSQSREGPEGPGVTLHQLSCWGSAVYQHEVDPTTVSEQLATSSCPCSQQVSEPHRRQLNHAAAS